MATVLSFLRARVREGPAPPEQALEVRVMEVLAAAAEPCGIAEIDRLGALPVRGSVCTDSRPGMARVEF